MTRLLITRGLPAAGKTTFARGLQPWVVRVNRDDLRVLLHGRRLFTGWAEAQVTAAQRSMVEALLRSRAAVIVDDTNLRSRVVRDWAVLAGRFGASFEVHDFTDVPLDECVRRDAGRPEAERVGEAVIRDLHDRYLARRSLPLPVPVAEPARRTYEPDPGLPPALLVGIDGTVAVPGEDTPNRAVIDAVRALHAAGNAVVFCTGRDEAGRAATETWLDAFVGVPYEELLMRPAGDTRRDAVVKREMFDRRIRQRRRIVGVFDDRQQVVRMWRSLGLTVFQVAEGDH